MSVAENATFDTNIAVYALSQHSKGLTAAGIVEACSFLSVQVLNEYANVAARKLHRDWPTIQADLKRLCGGQRMIVPVDHVTHTEAVRIAARYQLSIFDSLLLATGLKGGAAIFYSEDMHDGLLIDGTLRIVDPFR